jgi:shikimate dehydrogenase
MQKDANIELYGVIGHPVAHSLSPFLMNRAFRARGVNAVYLRFDVRPGQLERAVEGLVTLGARGVNVTYPFKEDALYLVDVPTPETQLIGAVNTLDFRDGRIIGANTDTDGTVSALEIFGDLPPRDKHIFIDGAGGSARAAAPGLLRNGAAGVTFGLRNPEDYEKPVAYLRDHFTEATVAIAPLGDTGPTSDYREHFQRADVVINATPVGMGEDSEASPLADPSWIRPDQCVFDFVYHPGRTRLLEMAQQAGARPLGGVTLLVCQAAESFQQWTGATFETRTMKAALETAFPERSVV